jgi:hypothetical protein
MKSFLRGKVIVEDEIKKLRLVVEVAREAWGEGYEDSPERR